MQFNEKGEDDLMGAVSKVDMVVEEAHQLGSDCELSDGSARILEMNRESYHHHPGATKDSRGCEDCEEEGKAAPAGSLRVRKCHACDRKKDLAERRYANNLQDREDIQTMDNQSASGAVEEFLPVINNMACSNNVGDGGVRIICTDSFSMVHEHTDVCAGETVSSTPSEEAERVLRRREILRTVKKESRTLLAAAAAAGIDPAAPAVDRKEKVCSGYSNAYTRAKMLHEKEIAALNERRDQELEEQELEKRERGWVTIGNGPVPKTVPTKNTSAVEVINPVGREPKERAFNKLRSLREKPDTQRVLGLVARRSESRVTSPTHRRIDTTERDEQHANLDHVISSSDSQRKLETKVETTSPGQTDNSTTTTTTLIRNEDDMVSAANGEGEPKPFRTSSERAISNPKPSSEMPSRQNSGSNRSSPRSSSCRVNDNPLYGTNSDVEPAACACNGVVANPAQLYSRQSSSLQPVAHSRVAVLTKPPETGSSSQTGEQKKNKKSSSFSSPKTTPSYMTPVPSPSFQSASASPACRSPEPTKQQTIAKTSFPLEHVGVQGAVEIVADEERSSSSTCGRSSKEKVRVIQLRGGGGDEQKNCMGFVDSRKFSSSRPCPGATLCKKVLENQQEVGSKLQPEVVPSKGCRPWKSIVLWPAHKTYQALAFQLKVAAKLLFFLTWMLKSILYGFGKALFMPVVILSTVANMVVSWITWPFGCIDRGRYSGCECLAKTYILLVLSSLFLPSLFDFDFFLVHKFVEGEVVIREGLHFDYTKTHPVAVVHVLPQHIIHRSKGFSFNLPDKEVMAARAFPASHKFQVTVHLTVPESEYNHQIGMFQVRMYRLFASSLIFASMCSRQLEQPNLYDYVQEHVQSISGCKRNTHCFSPFSSIACQECPGKSFHPYRKQETSHSKATQRESLVSSLRELHVTNVKEKSDILTFFTSRQREG